MTDTLSELKRWLERQYREALHNRNGLGSRDYVDASGYDGERAAYLKCQKKIAELEAENVGND